MVKAQLPADEAQRLAALRALKILDTPAEERFDRITRLAQRLFDVPIVLITLIDADRQWVKSCHGVSRSETSRDVSFCAHAILGDDTLVIPDAQVDPRFADNPWVTGEPYMRFYAGHPLSDPSGHKLGTLCIVDRRPRTLSEDDLAALRDLASLVEHELNRVELGEALAIQRESEARVRAIMDNVADGIITFNEQRIIESCNRAAGQIFGYLADDLVGQHLTMLTPVAYRTGLDQLLAGARGGNGDRLIARRELIYRRKDGTQLPIELAISETCLNEQRLFIAVFHDITQRKQAEEALRASEERFRQLADNIDEIFWIADTQTMRRLYVSPAYERIVGRSCQSLLEDPASLFEAIHPDDRERIRAAQARQQRSTYNEEYRIVRPDGEIRWIHSQAFPIRNDRGEVYRIAGIAEDITERKRADDRLQQSMSTLQEQARLLDLAQDAILVRDFEGTITFWNHGAEEMYGWTKAEAIGKTTHELLQTVFPQPLAEILDDVILNGRWEGELVHRRQDGSTVTVASRWALQCDEQGEPQTILEINTDITARKRAEEAQAQARDQALEAARVKSEFLATMSHEIRTPMNGVIGMTELLLETPLDEEQREFAAIIRESGRALLTLIDDILDFSKIEAGKLVLESVDFEPVRVVEGAAQLLVSKAREKGVLLMTFVAPEIPPVVQGDPGRLRQVLLNLISNAVKFTDKGEVVVRASLEHADDSEVCVRFAVSDTGIGLSDAARRRLFQPFTQADGSTTRQYGGTGLGLAISKRLVEFMGGTIGVESVEGQGSTFWFTARFGFVPTATALATPPARAHLRGLHVLIVDDSATSQEIIQSYARSWGMRDACAADGRAALAELHRGAETDDPYQVAIVDLAMPDMDGFALARAIQRDPALGAPRLILLTAFDERGQGEQALQAGFAAYLTKPVLRSMLFDAIANATADIPHEAEEGEAEQETPPATASEQTGPAVARPAGPPILLVEDNAANQKVAQHQLERLGYVVDTVNNGREAVEAIEHAPARYAAVLMDCAMPVMDGFAATHAIRKLELTSGKHIPIIAMTANALQGDRETCLAAGMDDYLSKPLTRDTLAATLERWTRTADDDIDRLHSAV